MSSEDSTASRVGLLARPGGVGLAFLAAAVWFVVGGVAFSMVAGPAPRWALPIVGVVWLLPAVAVPVFLRARTTVRLVADGIAFSTRGGDRLVPYSQIEDIAIDAQRITLRLRDGSVEYIQEVGAFNMTSDSRDLSFAPALREAWTRARALKAPQP